MTRIFEMNYVDECNEYAVAAAKLAGKYEFLIAMQEDVRRIFMQELDEHLDLEEKNDAYNKNTT